MNIGWRKMVLTASIALNVLFVGVGGGMAYKHISRHPWFDVRNELSPETRSIVGRGFQAAYQDIQPLGDKTRKARKEMVKILSAEEFDEEAYDRVAKKMSALHGEMMAKKMEATKAIAAELPAEERAKMAKRMTRMFGGGREKRFDRMKRLREMREKRVKKMGYGPQAPHVQE